MIKIIKKVFLFYSLILLGCISEGKSHNNINNPPTKSFVKVLHNIKVLNCTDQQNTSCQIGEWSRSGSGMSVEIISDKNTVITAGHVCNVEVNEKIVKEHIQSVYVLDHQDTMHQAYVISHSSINDGNNSTDLCLLWVPTLNVPKIKISKQEPIVGEDLYYIGAPAGIYHPPVAPIFKGIFSGKLDGSSSMFTAPAMGGSSGSAVLNNRNELVGVLFAANSKFHHISLITNYYSTVIFITRTLKELKSLDLSTQ